MIKILIVGMTENPGGMESFVLNYLERLDQSGIHFDFLSNTEKVNTKFIVIKTPLIWLIFTF